MLESFGLSGSLANVLRYFLIRPDARPYVRQLQRAVGLGGGALHRTLGRLEALGALQREADGELVRYEASWSSPAWSAARTLASTEDEILILVENALADVDGLDAAFVVGSIAAGEGRGDSDIDVFVLEKEDADSRKLLRHLAEVGLLLDRPVNALRYTPEELAERLGDPAHSGGRFIRNLLTGPKVWLAGDGEVLRPVAKAGGLADIGLVT